MTRKEFLQHYWRYYLVLEEKFKNTLNYIELDWQNAGTFSNEYALLLQSIGAELDNFFMLIWMTLHHSFIPVLVWHLKTRKKISVLDFGTGLTHRRTCELAKTFDTTCRCCSNNVVSRGRHSDNPNYGYLESASAFFYSVAAACAFS